MIDNSGGMGRGRGRSMALRGVVGGGRVAAGITEGVVYAV